MTSSISANQLLSMSGSVDDTQKSFGASLSGFPASMLTQQASAVVALRPKTSSGTPGLLTGKDAQESANRIATEAWQPAVKERETDVGLGEYTGLQETIEGNRAKGMPVLATYGEIIFFGSEGGDHKKELSNITSAIKEIEATSTGKKLLSDLGGSKGVPVAVFLNGYQDDSAKNFETGIIEPRFGRNFDVVNWDPTSALQSKLGGAPAWSGLSHELRHTQQMEEERLENVNTQYPDGRIGDSISWKLRDEDRNGTSDTEDNATVVENKILREAGLKLFREVYKEPSFPIRMKDSTSVPPAGTGDIQKKPTEMDIFNGMMRP